MLNSLSVGLGEIKISTNPEDVLIAYGLGSCLGIGMHDPFIRASGLLHAVLPRHTNGTDSLSSKYVDSGIQLLLDQLARKGADPRRLIIRIAGGANMLAAPGFSKILNIGNRNIEAAYTTLSELNLKIASQEVGGTIGRTVRFYIMDGRMTIRTMGNQEREV
jgi:chemotaxis protein CheD